MKSLLLLGFTFLSVYSYSQTHVWNGSAGDNDWFNATNWDAGTVPTASSTVLIEAGLVNIITSSASAMTIDLSLNSILTVENDLSVTGDLHISSTDFLIIKSGTLSNATIQNFGTFHFETLDPKYLDNVTINNYYTMAVLNSGVIHLDNTVTITNMDTGNIFINSPGGIVEDSGIATVNNQGNIILDSPSPKSFYMIFDMNNEGIIEIRESHTFLFLVGSQNFTNLSNGILQGEGTFDITANFINNGIVVPRSSGDYGTIDFLNNFHFPPTATFEIDVLSTTQHDVIAIFGSPLIEGSLDVNLQSALNLNDELIVISSSNSLSCNLPTTINATHNDLVYTFDVACNTNEVILKVSSIETLSVNNFSENDALFIASPNPVSEEITFNLDAMALQENSNLTIEVYTLLGQRICKVPATEIETKINLSQFSSGIYISHLVSEKGVIAKSKIVVE